MPLEVTGLKRSYDDFSVTLDFRVEMGETLALVGPSGSGKTTALNLLAGLAEQDEGKIIIGGEDISALPSWKRNISVVFQDLALFPHLDAGKNIAYGLMIRGVKRKELARIVNETLEIVRLPGYASRRVDTLSGGERQRIALARALASSPRALLLDEPFSSLDAPLRKELRREFLGIRAHSEAPCIFVTHDREEAMMLGDRVALMRDGRIVESGPGRELLLSPKTEFTARFFGAGQVLPCEITGKTGSAAEVSSPLGSLTVPPLPEYDSAPYRLFIPHDAFCFEEPANRAEYRPLDAVADEVIPEGLGTLVKLRPAAREYSGPNPAPVELIIGPRVKPPSAGSAIKLWVNQNLLKFVRAG